VSEMSLEEMEAQTKAIEAQLAAARAKKAKKVKPSERPIVAIQKDQSVKNATLKNSHGGYCGRSLIERIEQQMDKRRGIMESMVEKNGIEKCLLSTVYVVNKGRYEGLAAALAILRSSSFSEEVNRSNERLEIE